MRSCSTTRDPRRYNGSRSVRGRQSANPRITGGLVSHDQGKRVRANPVGIRDTPTGSKRAAIPVAWSACRDPPALAATYGSSHTAAANISRLPARRVISPGARMQVPTNLPLTSSTSRSQDPHHRTPSPPDSIATGLHRQLLRVPRQPLQHGQQLPPVIDSAYVNGLASGRVRRLDRQHDRCPEFRSW
jgi:hypothetical protein